MQSISTSVNRKRGHNKYFAAAMALVLLFPVVFGGMARDIAYAQETLPQTQTQTQTDSKWYQNFEHAGEGGTYGISAVGTSSTASVTNRTPGGGSRGSVRLIQTNDNNPGGGAWNIAVYGFTVSPQKDTVTEETYYDASAYNYLNFYILDADVHNPNVVIRDADGKEWNANTDQALSVKDEWTRLSIPLDKTKLDFSRIVSISLGEYWGWGNIYYFDELYFAKSATAPPPAYPDDGVEPSAPVMYQSFEQPGSDGSYGLAGQGTATVAQRVTAAAAYSSSSGSLKMMQNTYMDGEGKERNEAWNTSVYGAGIKPEGGLTVSGATYMDASPFSYLLFYVKDTTAAAGSSIHVVFKDAEGGVWDTETNAAVKTESKQWVKMTVKLDKSKIDLSRLEQIELGTYWGYGNVYYYDDLYLAQNETDPSPAFKPERTALFNDFESRTGYSAGSATTAEASGEIANAAGIAGVMVTTSKNDWPYTAGSYLSVQPKEGGTFDASAYSYLAFYLKDTQGSNGVEFRIKDANGGVWDTWGTSSSTKNKWVKMQLSLKGASKIDLTKIVSVEVGFYNAGVYYLDDMYFAMAEDDVLAGFISGTQNIGAVWYQSFETKGQDGRYGITAGTGVSTALSMEKSASAYNSASIRAVLSQDSSNPAMNGIAVRPQALEESPDKNLPYDYQPEFDATNFSHLIFYVWDEQGGQTLSVQLKDAGGKTVDWRTGETTADGWNRIVIPLDKGANFQFARLSAVTVTPVKAGTYYLDEFYFGKNESAGFPNAGFTQLVLKDVNGEAMPYSSNLPLGSFEKQQDRTYLSLNGDWKKERTTLDSKLSAAPRDSARTAGLEEEAGGRQEIGYNDSSWTGKTLPLPEDEGVVYESLSGPENKSDKSGYQGGVWYRKHFEVSSSLKGQPAQLTFLGVNYFGDVWINGQYAGGHQGGYTPFALDVSGLLNYGGDNVIAVRVDNPKWDTFNNGEILPYATSDWFNYTGILRDAYVEFMPETYVVRSDVRTLDTDGQLSVRTFLNHTGKTLKQVQLSYTVYEAEIGEGNQLSEYAQDLTGTEAVAAQGSIFTVPVNGQAVQTIEVKVPEPKLWSPSEPNLYILKVEQKTGGAVTDTFYTQFGIRTLEAEGVQLKLNGELAPFLTGVGYTEDSSDKGPSLDNATRYSDLLKIREELKANFVRTGHFPHSLPTYQYADRIGLAIWQEIPAYWFSGEAFDLQRQRGQAKQMMEEMIFSNYNRPSVWFDGVSNESGGQLERVNFIQELRDAAHAIDGTRLVGQSAVANPYKGVSDHSHSPADIIGMTMYFGAFYGANTDLETQEEIEAIHALHPGKPIIATEYGYWSGDETASDTRQTTLFTGTFNAFARTATRAEDGTPNPDGLLSGAAWWTAYNWYTNITGLQTMGLYHMDRTTPKQVKDILADRYNRYNRISAGTQPKPAGISTWFQSFESGRGYLSSSAQLQLESAADSAAGNGTKSLKITAGSGADGTYASFVPQGGAINSDLTGYNYLNFYAKDSVGDRPLSITLVDAEGRSWTTETEGKTVKDAWTRLSVPLLKAQGVPLSGRKLNTLAITQIRIGMNASEQLWVDNFFAATYKTGAEPASYPIGSSGWFQSFEETDVQVGQGVNATAMVDRTFGVNPGGTGSVKLEVTGDGGSPGADKQSVIIKPQGGAASIDASGFNYLAFYVKDMQGSNTVHVTFVDTDGTVSVNNWTDIGSVKGQWTKVFLPLMKTSADISSLKEIRLSEWNPGTYYFDDLYFAEYPSDEIPATYTEKIPEKNRPEGQLKVAAVGDSITAGAGLKYAGVTSYPAQLQSLLGSNFVVKNFGVSGRTLLKDGDDPYWNESAFAASQTYAPDVVVIQLGTNDTKSWNWKEGQNQFLSNYKELIQLYQALPSHPKVFVNLPPAVFNDDPNQAYGIVNSVLQNGVIPLIRQAAEATGATLIDVNAATAGSRSDFPDKIHPNPKGAWTLADTVAKAIRGTLYSIGDTEITTWKDGKAGAYSIMYDDGIYNSVLRFAGLHEKYSLKGTLALISGWIDDGFNDTGASTGTWDQWKGLLDKGIFDVASHTVTHRNLTTLSASNVSSEFKDSVARIKEKTGYSPESLALPYNTGNAAVAAEAAKYFVAARQGGNNAGNASSTEQYYNLSSTMVESTTTTVQLDEWTDFGIAKGNWLILTGHGNDGEGWSSPPLSLYDNHYGYVAQRIDALWNGTIAEVGKYLRERQNATVKATKKAASGAIEVKLEGTLDPAVYNEPLTLRTKVPAEWNEVTVTRGATSYNLKPVREGEGAFVYYEAVPGTQMLVISKKGTDTPTPDTGTPTPAPSVSVAATDSTKSVLAPGTAELTKALAAAPADTNGVRTLTFKAGSAAGKTTFELQLPASYLASMKQVRIQFITPAGSLLLPGDMFAGMAKEAKQIAVSVKLADLSGADEDVKQAAGSRPAVELSATVDGNPVNWQNNLATVTFRTPYQLSSAEALNPSQLTFWQIGKDGKGQPVVSGRYDSVGGEMLFTTHHFSRYVVVSVAKNFGDLGRYGWAQAAVEALASKGAIQGVSQHSYSPAQTVTRADAVVMIMRLFDLQAQATHSFTDIAQAAYYYEDVNAARTLGIVRGSGSGEFRPEQPVTRQEMMMMLDSAMLAAGRERSVVRGEALAEFRDASQVSSYARESVARAVSSGLFQGYNGYLQPVSPINRAEAAVTLYRLYGIMY
ncbi:S-layer homology domain-containing protein [Paenibacillus sp. Marseille-Q9583]